MYDNAMIQAGLLEDPRTMVNRLNDLLSKALEKYWETHTKILGIADFVSEF